jgi:DUF4097 and DUF4098 domain-containing protein YvlB
MRYRTILIMLVLSISWTTGVARSGKHPKKPHDQQSERTSAADSRVVLSVCLRSGSITVRGWDRNQVRASSSDGMAIEFQRPPGNDSDLPKELTLVSDKGKSRLEGRCLSFGDIELDVPREASVNLQAGNSEINASGLARLRITAQSGSISIARVTQAVDVKTISGEISMASSKGSIKLHSVSGSIEVHDVSPNDAGDVCEAGTVSGDVTLDQIRHAQVVVNAVNGSLSYSGPLMPAGRYSFETISGNIDLLLPANSSFRLSATLSANEEFSSDFPLQSSSTETLQGDKNGLELRHINATYGTANISITISSFNGSIQLRRK